MTPGDPGGTARRRAEVITVYAAGLVQGLSLVAFPAAAGVLTSKTGYDLSASQYGVLFLPQVVVAIGAALSMPSLSHRLGLKLVFLVGIAANAVSMALLVASDAVKSDPAAFPILLVATAFLGAGFGLTLSSISTFAGAFQPDRRAAALTSLNVLLGLGTALSPLLIALFVDYAEWWYLPVLAAIGLVAVGVAGGAQPLTIDDAPAAGATAARRPHIPTLFFVFAGALVLYGVGETMFGNWGTTLLRDEGVSASAANYALAAFWAAVTLGRLAISLSSGRVRGTLVYVVLPWAIAAVLVAVPWADSEGEGILVFALGGLACSGFFPMTVGYGESSFPRLVELSAGWLIAAYQLGYGLAAFGAGLLQHEASLRTIFRIAAILAVVMAGLALPIARRQRPADHSAVSTVGAVR